MSNSKKYYYMRLTENFFDSAAMIALENLPNGYLFSNILLKLYCKSLRGNGRLMLSETIPYDAKIIAKITGHKVSIVKKALAVFSELGFIETLENGAIYMLDIQKYIGKSTSEADRIREYRVLINSEKKPVQMYDDCTTKEHQSIEYRDKSIEIKELVPNSLSQPEVGDAEESLKKEVVPLPHETDLSKRTPPPLPYSEIVDLYNTICTSYPKVKKLSEARKKALRARLNSYSISDFKQLFEMAESSAFLKGKNDRNWAATFDWLIKDSNMVKVLDGNYADKTAKGGIQKNYDEKF